MMIGIAHDTPDQQAALERGMTAARMGRAVSRDEAAAMVDEIDAMRSLYQRKDFAFDELVRLHEERDAIARDRDTKIEALIAENERLMQDRERIQGAYLGAAAKSEQLRSAIAEMGNTANAALVDDDAQHDALLAVERMARAALSQEVQP